MKILSVETSGKTFSIAINEDGKTIVEFYYDYGHIHSEMLIPSIEKALKDTDNEYKDIDKFAVSIGPGSFTGIRVGMTAIKILAQSLNKPIIAVDSLTVLENALAKIKGIKIIPAIDALRNEIYIKSGKKIIIKNIDDFIKANKKYKNKIIIIGNAAQVYKEKLSKDLGRMSISLPDIMHMPKASVLASLANKLKDSDRKFNEVKPLYIRRSWAEESKKK